MFDSAVAYAEERESNQGASSFSRPSTVSVSDSNQERAVDSNRIARLKGPIFKDSLAFAIAFLDVFFQGNEIRCTYMLTLIYHY